MQTGNIAFKKVFPLSGIISGRKYHYHSHEADQKYDITKLCWFSIAVGVWTSFELCIQSLVFKNERWEHSHTHTLSLSIYIYIYIKPYTHVIVCKYSGINRMV